MKPPHSYKKDDIEDKTRPATISESALTGNLRAKQEKKNTTSFRILCESTNTAVTAQHTMRNTHTGEAPNADREYLRDGPAKKKKT